jgi:hypothetical protein
VTALAILCATPPCWARSRLQHAVPAFRPCARTHVGKSSLLRLVTCWGVAVASVPVIGVVAAWIVGVVTAGVVGVVSAWSTWAWRNDARGRHHHGGVDARLADSSSPDVGLLVVVGGLGGTDDLGQGAGWGILAGSIADVEAGGVATGHLIGTADRRNNNDDCGDSWCA